MSEANKAIAIKIIEAVGVGDLATLEALLSKDVQVTTAGNSSLSGTRDYATVMAIGKAFTQIMSSGGIKFKFLNLTAEDDRVAVEARGTAKMLNGDDYNNEYHFLVCIREGKVYKLVEYLDTKLADRVLAPYLLKIAVSQ